MKRIGLISDTHGFLHPDLLNVMSDCDELWHAGDLGSMEVLRSLEECKPTRAVWGNIDDSVVRQAIDEDLLLETNGIRILISHIIGHPKRLHRRARPILSKLDPDLVIYGHSHILRLDYDSRQRLFINPGAIGNQGIHQIRTAMKFDLDLANRRLRNFQILEFGNRGQTPESVTKAVPLDDWRLRPVAES